MFTAEEIITTDKYRSCFPTLYTKTDYLVSCEAPERTNQVMLSGHSDYGVTQDMVDHFNPRVWFAVNKSCRDERVQALPLGITNNTQESPLHPIYGNVECMVQIMQEDVPKAPALLYLNFSIDTYPEERAYVWDLLSDKPWAAVGTHEPTLEGRTRYLRDIKAHTFVACPRGNGVDTHRLWETLYMGSIPVVKREVGYRDFEGLYPICFVDEWDQVTESFLQQEEKRIRAKQWDRTYLTIGYWATVVTAYILYP
jgi:hypothetical protein